MPGWLTNFANYLGKWMVSPWLLLGGLALLVVPIIIHLLNKRKFRTLDWAAIDFLLEADKMNRRRIRLENLLLLALRCLAVLLIALLLSRPFRPKTFADGALQSVRFERIVVLDDSLSMLAVDENRSSFDVAKKTVENLVESLRSADSDESFSLVRLSQPDRPVIRGVQLNEESVRDLVGDIQSLEPSDSPVRLEGAMLEIEKLLRIEPEYVNRVVYFVSDLRSRDWDFAASDEAQGARETLDRIANKSVGCFIVDAGNQNPGGNIVVSSVAPKDKVLIAGVQTPFEVTVANNGPSEVKNVQVSFSAGESLPLTDKIERIPSNSTKTVPFSFTFAKPDSDPSATTKTSEAVRIRVAVTADGQGNRDQLREDNSQFFAARFERGIRTLLVDGDPSASYGQSETFSLKRALAPPGDLLSGVSLDVVTEVEFDSVKLDDYRVIYLCNLYRLTETRRAAIEKWVEAGGALVLCVGDQIDEHVYNDTLYQDGEGLLPGKLIGVLGDESEKTWVNFRVSNANHPALSVFAGEKNPFASWVKVFRWWSIEPNAEQVAKGEVVVSARFSDPQNSPAVLEKQFGEGRVILVATPADRDWNNWPLDPSYLIFSQELTRYAVNKANLDGTITVGQSIRHPLDLTRYKMNVSLRHPNESTTPLDAQPADNADSKSVDETSWIVDYDKVDKRGFYELNLKRTNGTSETELFAANVDASEGNLRRVDLVDLQRSVQDSPIEIVNAEKLVGDSAIGAEGELWPLILCLAVLALCGEQLLGWFFGRSR